MIISLNPTRPVYERQSLTFIAAKKKKKYSDWWLFTWHHCCCVHFYSLGNVYLQDFKNMWIKHNANDVNTQKGYRQIIVAFWVQDKKKINKKKYGLSY